MVDPTEGGLSVEALLTGRGQLPAPVFAAVLRNGGVMLNRRRVATAAQPVQPRDELVAHVLSKGSVPQGPEPLDPSRILLMDEHVVAVNKPPGMAAQGTQTEAEGGLDAALRALLTKQRERNTFVGLVHRLDLETSGVTLFARTAAALTDLTAQFRESGVRKRYLALANGAPKWTNRRVDQPLGPDPQKQGAQCITPRGRPATSDFTVLERHDSWCRIEVHPLTGRTHQIRVHAQSLGHPLLGDRRYGGPDALTFPSGRRVEIPRVALHAAELRCRHPAGGELHIEAPWPDDLAEVEARCRGMT